MSEVLKGALTKEWYGITRWHPNDIIAAAESNGVKMTQFQAVEWWNRNEKYFIERMTELGNEVLADMDFE